MSTEAINLPILNGFRHHYCCSCVYSHGRRRLVGLVYRSIEFTHCQTNNKPSGGDNAHSWMCCSENLSLHMHIVAQEIVVLCSVTVKELKTVIQNIISTVYCLLMVHRVSI